jgi:hypothetical protein
LLVRHEGVTLVAGCEFGLLHHFCVVLHAFATGVVVGELEGVGSANPLENSMPDIGLEAACVTVIHTTHRNPNLRPETGAYGVCRVEKNYRQISVRPRPKADHLCPPPEAIMEPRPL